MTEYMDPRTDNYLVFLRAILRRFFNLCLFIFERRFLSVLLMRQITLLKRSQDKSRRAEESMFVCASAVDGRIETELEDRTGVTDLQAFCNARDGNRFKLEG